jgi:CheY-like chemotaxis protein
MSASVTQLLSSWINAAGVGVWTASFNRFGAAGLTGVPDVLGARAGAERALGGIPLRTGAAISTDILRHERVPFTPPKPIAPTPEDLRGSTVLVVDDERAWRVILETDLRMLGYKVSMAEDADQALERAQSDQPEVAIIDLMLPEPMDGWGLLNELRARGQKLPVIFYTAYPVFPSGTDDPDVVGYMSKAVDRADLYALLPPAIRRSRERRNA